MAEFRNGWEPASTEALDAAARDLSSVLRAQGCEKEAEFIETFVDFVKSREVDVQSARTASEDAFAQAERYAKPGVLDKAKEAASHAFDRASSGISDVARSAAERFARAAENVKRTGRETVGYVIEGTRLPEMYEGISRACEVCAQGVDATVTALQDFAQWRAGVGEAVKNLGRALSGKEQLPTMVEAETVEIVLRKQTRLEAMAEGLHRGGDRAAERASGLRDFVAAAYEPDRNVPAAGGSRLATEAEMKAAGVQDVKRMLEKSGAKSSPPPRRADAAPSARNPREQTAQAKAASKATPAPSKTAVMPPVSAR